MGEAGLPQARLMRGLSNKDGLNKIDKISDFIEEEKVRQNKGFPLGAQFAGGKRFAPTEARAETAGLPQARLMRGLSNKDGLNNSRRGKVILSVPCCFYSGKFQIAKKISIQKSF